MKYVIIIVWVLLVLFVLQKSTVNAQAPQVKLIFKVGEKEVEVCKYEVYISDPDKKIELVELQTDKTGIITPANIKQYRKVNIRVIFDKYNLDFHDVDPGLFDSEWEIGVKLPPFEEDSEEKPEEVANKKLIMVYYIAFHPHDSEGKYQKVSVFQ